MARDPPLAEQRLEPARSGHSTKVDEVGPEVGVEQPGILVVEAAEAVEVEVRDGRRAS